MKKAMDLKDLPVGQKVKKATELGNKVGAILEKAEKAANKLLNKHGYRLFLEVKIAEMTPEQAQEIAEKTES